MRTFICLAVFAGFSHLHIKPPIITSVAMIIWLCFAMAQDLKELRKADK